MLLFCSYVFCIPFSHMLLCKSLPATLLDSSVIQQNLQFAFHLREGNVLYGVECHNSGIPYASLADCDANSTLQSLCSNCMLT